MTTAVAERPAAPQKQTLVAKFASKYSIEPEKLLGTLKATAFRQNGNQDISNEQMAALLIVADQYGLNPFTREIYAFPDKGGIVPVVGVDGWSRIINEHPQSDGFEFVESEETTTFEGKQVPVWMEVHIYRKDRARPIKVRERFAEVVRAAMQPWKSHPARMMRHKTLIQGARLAYGFAGIYDEDEAQRIVERDMGTADVVGNGAPAVQMPQARPRQIQQQEARPIDMPAQRVAQGEPVQRQAAPVPAPAPATATAAELDDAVTDGEKQWIRNKLTGAEIAIEDAIATLCLSVPASLDGLTRDGFIAFQDYIRENC
ncbi:phage recombination protein Bet [Cupriavidus sp. JZ107]